MLLVPANKRSVFGPENVQGLPMGVYPGGSDREGFFSGGQVSVGERRLSSTLPVTEAEVLTRKHPKWRNRTSDREYDVRF